MASDRRDNVTDTTRYHPKPFGKMTFSESELQSEEPTLDQRVSPINLTIFIQLENVS